MSRDNAQDRATAVVHALLALAIAATWLGRGGMLIALPTTAVAFADFPLVLLALAVTVQREGADRTAPMRRWILALLTVMFLSAILNGAPPLRAAAGGLLLLEPFAMIFAILRARQSVRGERLLLRATAVTLAAQLPVALYQFTTLGPGDPVQGTLVGAGAGAHVLGAGALMGGAAFWATHRGRTSTLLVLTVCLAVMWMSDAKQVLITIPLAVGIIVLKLKGLPTFGRMVGAGVVGLAAVSVVYALLADTYAVNALRLTVQSGGGKIAVAEAIENDLEQGGIGTQALGLGAGQSVSRLAFLTSSQGVREGSPVQALGLEGSVQTERYIAATTAQGYVGETSFSAAQSSLLGVLGDYGWVGLFAYLGLISSLCRALWRSPHPLSAPALAGWVVALPLGIIADWLEQPPFMLLVAMLTGLSLGDENLNIPDRGRLQKSGRAARPISPLTPSRRNQTRAGVIGPKRVRGERH